MFREPDMEEPSSSQQSTIFAPDSQLLAWEKDMQVPKITWASLSLTSTWQNFFKKNIRNTNDFANYMYGVSIQRYPCPFKEKSDIKSLNPSAQKLLVDMNQTRRFITGKFKNSESMSGYHSPVNRSVSRAHLTAFIPTRDCLRFENEMSARDFFCFSQALGAPKVPVQKTTCDLTLDTPFPYSWHFDSMHPQLQDQLREHWRQVHILDPVSFRAAQDPDGLFTMVLCVLKNMCDE